MNKKTLLFAMAFALACALATPAWATERVLGFVNLDGDDDIDTVFYDPNAEFDYTEDTDGDGDPDLWVTSDPELLVDEKDIDGDLEEEEIIFSIHMPPGVSVAADADGDGDIDVVYTGGL